MHRLKVIRLSAICLAALALVTILPGTRALGQKRFVKFNVPYGFNFGGEQLPAGEYSFSVDGQRLIAQSATSGKFGQNIVTRMTGPVEFYRDGSLVFEKSANAHILSEVWIPGIDGILLHSISKGRERSMIMRSDLSETSALPGQIVFNHTCAKCHGSDGNGEKEAAKFFATTIPKLTSPAIQAKSDDELRMLISKGSEKMPPVEMDESGFRHRLPPQDVEAVIAYLHTLKK